MSGADSPGHGLPAEAISVRHIRSAGPGGQHVNKVSTGIQLRLTLAASGLPQAVLARLRVLAGQRLNRDDELVIEATRHRSQTDNLRDAHERLAVLVERARARPTVRVPTRVPAGARRARLDDKKRRGAVKRGRGRPDGAD